VEECVPGQRWKYRTRPGEDGSTVTVMRLESDALLGDLVHVVVEGVAVLNPRLESGLQTSICFVPLERRAFHESVTRLVATEEIAESVRAEFEDAYRAWHDEPEGHGAFSIPLAEIVALLERSLM